MPSEEEIMAALSHIPGGFSWDKRKSIAKAALEAAEKVRNQQFMDDALAGFYTSFENGELKRRYVTKEEMYLPTKQALQQPIEKE